MGRSGYSDDLDPRKLALWRGTVDRSIRGARGQKFLRDLVGALDSMPIKKLSTDVFVVDDGCCCAMGALAIHLGLPIESLAKVDGEDRDEVAAILDIAPALAAEVAFVNDEYWSFTSETEEDRWSRMRGWAQGHIIANSSATRSVE